MVLLTIYVAVALGFSFLCSIAEAVILSVSSAHISVLKKNQNKSGHILEDLTQDINKPLSAILTLNTIAHTMGAAGAGAQAAKVFGDAYLGLISAVLTLLILVFSEIIPKTLGATFWRQLAPITAYFLKYLIFALYPFVVMSKKLTGGFTEESPLKGLSREELHAMAEVSGQEGQLATHEANILKSLMSLHELTIRQAMTHRKDVFSLPQETTVEAFCAEFAENQFSRIPIFEDHDAEKIVGFVMKTDILIAQAQGKQHYPLVDFKKEMPTLLSSMALATTFDKFLSHKVHMLHVVDEYGGLEGILTLEDLLEALLGVDIKDESDANMSIRQLAHNLAKNRPLNNPNK
jgi:CBS domain containing-hemolysin-like protein